ncbi:MAG: hypothetical protein CL526_01025 [Aequorivita sp.]|nr:hypothetical protein [Aequorivita sp.]|tara:strand:- start:75792 stop:76682 length:891 start_codon:yes stop_codon:yes gene_type:complete
MKILQQHGNYYFLKKQHNTAIDSLQKALKIAGKFENLAEQIATSEAIANNYLALKNVTEFKKQNNITQQLYEVQTDVENEAVNTAFNFINNSQQEQLKKEKTFLKWNVILLTSMLIFILLLWRYLAFRYRLKTQQYKNYITFFEEKQKPTIEPQPVKKATKPSVVPKEMEKRILKKLSEFEKTKEFTNRDISLSRLAIQFETNTKYLSEVVNNHKQKNFNTYINELRVNYIIEKLKTNPTYLQYKISYLAEDSGFTSHSLFATVFKSVTGVPPTAFIAILKDKKELSKSNKTKHGD